MTHIMAAQMRASITERMHHSLSPYKRMAMAPVSGIAAWCLNLLQVACTGLICRCSRRGVVIYEYIPLYLVLVFLPHV